MCAEARTFYSKQRRTAVLSVVQPLFEIGKSTARKQKSNLPRNSFRESFLQRGADEVHHALGSLQRYVSDESVGDDHIYFPVVNIAAFYVADEVERQLFQELE